MKYIGRGLSRMIDFWTVGLYILWKTEWRCCDLVSVRWIYSNSFSFVSCFACFLSWMVMYLDHEDNCLLIILGDIIYCRPVDCVDFGLGKSCSYDCYVLEVSRSFSLFRVLP